MTGDIYWAFDSNYKAKNGFNHMLALDPPSLYAP